MLTNTFLHSAYLIKSCAKNSRLKFDDIDASVQILLLVVAK